MLEQASDLYQCTHDLQKERLSIDLNKCADDSSPPFPQVDFPTRSNTQLISPRQSSHGGSTQRHVATSASVHPCSPLSPSCLFPPSSHESLFCLFPIFNWEHLLLHQTRNISIITSPPDLKEEIKEDSVDGRRSLPAGDNEHKINALSITESPSWLPDGWITEIRTRKTGCTAGIRRKVFKHLASGRRFRTQKEVWHFLQTGKGRASKKCLHKSVVNGSLHGNHGRQQCTCLGVGELPDRQFQPFPMQFPENQTRVQVELPLLRESNFTQGKTEVMVTVEEPVEMDLCKPWKWAQKAFDDKMVTLELDSFRSHAGPVTERSGELSILGVLPQKNIVVDCEMQIGNSQYESSEGTVEDMIKSVLSRYPMVQTSATAFEQKQEGTQEGAPCLGSEQTCATDRAIIVTPKEKLGRSKDHLSVLDPELDLSGLNPGLTSQQRAKYVQKMKVKHAKELLASLGRKLCIEAIHLSAMNSSSK